MATEAAGAAVEFWQVLRTELRAIRERRSQAPSDDGPFPAVDAEQAAWKRAVRAAKVAREEELRRRGWPADNLSDGQKAAAWELEQAALVRAWGQEQERGRRLHARALGVQEELARLLEGQAGADKLLEELRLQVAAEVGTDGAAERAPRHPTAPEAAAGPPGGEGGASYAAAQRQAVLAEVERALGPGEELEQLRRHLHAEGGQTAPAAPDGRDAGPGGEAAAAEGPLTEARREALGMGLLGLALSGGGIRSATFNLGVLQGLARLGLLKRLDYLSTVSGGGYIGGWLAAWVKREGNVRHVEKQLRPARWQQKEGRKADRPLVYEEEPEPVFHLRSYSNYLAPRPGLLSTDSWVGASIYLRNLLLNQLLLLPALAALLLLTRLAMLFYAWDGGEQTWSSAYVWYVLFGGALVGALVLGAFNISRALERLRLTREKGVTRHGDLRTRKDKLYWRVVLPLVLAAFLFCWFAWGQPDPKQWPGWLAWLKGPLGRLSDWAHWGLYGRAAVAFALLFALPFGLVHAYFAWRSRAGLPWWKVVGRMAFLGLAGAAGGAAGGALLGLLLVLTESLFREDDLADAAREAATVLTLGPPVALLVFTLGAFLFIGVMGRRLGEDEREWWASLCGRLLLIAAGWAALCALSFFSVPLLLWAGPMARTAVGAGWLATAVSGLMAARGPQTGNGTPRRSPLRELLALAAPYVILAGLLVGLSYVISYYVDSPPPAALADWRVPPRRAPAEADTPVVHTRTEVRGPLPARLEKDTREYSEQADPTAARNWRYWAGLLNTVDADTQLPALASLALGSAAAPSGPRTLHAVASVASWRGYDRGQVLRRLLRWLVLCGVVLLAASRCVSINVFSMHGTYGNRLVRCYLGASREKVQEQTDRPHGVRPNSAGPRRNPDPITGFDPNDDFPLHDLAPGPRVPWDGPDLASRRMPYWGPYLLVNTAMNLVEGDELAWQERKAESFVLTPEYCGSKSTGYRPLPGFARNLSLGNAVTVSGAAASPNMGYHSSPAVTALLTVFNVRLGAWLGNPRVGSAEDLRPRKWRRLRRLLGRPLSETLLGPAEPWRSTGPPWSLGLLLQELFGRTDIHYDYVYLSDGGHFENLGAYELVRRRCRYIIVCDAGEDGAYAFDDLGDLIRKCKSDFGVPIEIDVTQLRPQGEAGRSKWHCAVGKVRYDCVHPDAVPGLLVYLKASLTGDEPEDVLNYKAKHPDFPHQSTGNQFFTESQFESYRALGEHILEAVFEDAMHGVDATARMSDAAHRRVVGQLFANLHRRWFPPPPKLEESYLESVKACIDLEVALREDKHLAHFSRTLYPESDGVAADGKANGTPPPATATPSDGGKGEGSTSADAASGDRGDAAADPKAGGKGAADSPPAGQGAGDAADQVRAEIHAVSQMLQVMEDAWLGVRLEGYNAHPMNRGWMNALRRWTASDVFRKYWLLLRGEYSWDFVRFCESELGLDPGCPEPRPQHDLGELGGPQWDELCAEFAAEWSVEHAPGGLPALVAGAAQLRERLRADGRPPLPVWVVTLAPKTQLVGGVAPPPHYPCGVILVWQPAGLEPDFELVVWLRGAYRNLGIGRDCLEGPLREIRQALPAVYGRKLRVRFPGMAQLGSGNRMRKEMWLRFFGHYGFHRNVSPGRAWAKDLVLEREYYPLEAAAAKAEAGK